LFAFVAICFAYAFVAVRVICVICGMSNESATEKKYLTIAQASQRYAVSVRHIYNLAKAGWPHVRLGRKCIRLPLAAWDQKMIEHTIGGEQ